MAVILAFSISIFIVYHEQVYNLLLFFFYPNFSLLSKSWRHAPGALFAGSWAGA
jgi:hypothetical protein